MRRFLPLLAILLMACGIAGSTAGMEPLTGLYELRPVTDLAAIRFPEGNDYQNTFAPLTIPTVDTDGLDLEETCAVVFPAGSAAARQMVIAHAKDLTFSLLYLDRDGDGSVTEEERIPVNVEPVETFDKRLQNLALWTIKPQATLAMEAEYKAANGAVRTGILTYQFEVLSCYNNYLSQGFCLVISYLRTHFVGEIATGGGRPMKVAVVDGNANGVFNEPEADFILLDSDFDNVFDWNKERGLLGQGISGLTAEGKQTTLIPRVSAWPQRLFLGPAGAAVNPAEL